MNIRKLFEAFGRDVLFLLLIGGMLVYMDTADFIISFKPAVSFEDMLDGTEVKAGSHVSGNVVFALDYFASESTYTKRSDGSRSGSKKSGNYYLIPTADGYIGLKSIQADVDALNKISDETFDYLNGGAEPSTVFEMEGSVQVMEDELAKYYKEYLTDMGYSDAEIEGFGTPLVIQNRNFTAIRVMFAVGVVFLFLGILIWVRRYRRESGLQRAEDLPDAM